MGVYLAMDEKKRIYRSRPELEVRGKAGMPMPALWPPIKRGQVDDVPVEQDGVLGGPAAGGGVVVAGAEAVEAGVGVVEAAGEAEGLEAGVGVVEDAAPGVVAKGLYDGAGLSLDDVVDAARWSERRRYKTPSFDMRSWTCERRA